MKYVVYENIGIDHSPLIVEIYNTLEEAKALVLKYSAPVWTTFQVSGQKHWKLQRQARWFYIAEVIT